MTCPPRRNIVLVSLALVLAAPRALAHGNGYASEGCEGCHQGGKAPTVTLTVDPATLSPGQEVTFDVAISAVNGDVGGFFLLTDGHGALSAIDGQGTRLIDPSQIVQSSPKQQSGGAVHFSVHWTAPSSAGGEVVRVWGVSANGNGQSSGDGASFAVLSFVYGCTGSTYYRDNDGDGYGEDDDAIVACGQPANYTAKGGDCDDNNPNIHPGATEVCNNEDDNCNNEVDEGLQVAMQYEDDDGDHYGRPDGKTLMAKCPPAGYAATEDDCNDNDPAVHPGATEVCNYVDDNCNDQVDEGVRVLCGVGFCQRQAESCGPDAPCMPGQPTPEACDGLDDDCNGEVDDGPNLCAAGMACVGGECVVGDGGGAGGVQTTGAGGTGGVQTTGAGGAAKGKGGEGSGAAGDDDDDGGSGSSCSMGAPQDLGVGCAFGAALTLLASLRRRGPRRRRG